MVAHLLDGDLASNHLSWQWVAGTASQKPYLFNADNVARHAPAVWHSAGSVIDASYEVLDAIARSPCPIPVRSLDEGVDEPPLSSRAPRGAAPRAADVAGRDVWLIHPWGLGEPPADLPAGCLHVTWWPTEHHAGWPWSAARRDFVGTRMAALAALHWHGSHQQLAEALAAARSVHAPADEHLSPLLPQVVNLRPAPRLFPEIDLPCASFTAWWNRATRGLRQLSDLPGLTVQVERRVAEPLSAPAAGAFTPSLTIASAACRGRTFP